MNDDDELNELYQSLVLEHSKNPRNFGKIEYACHHTKGKNPSCGDEINLYVKSEKNNSLINEIKFTGQGCALCIASTSLMTQITKNKTLAESEKIANDFINFIVNDVELSEDYEPLHIFKGVKNFPLRVKCVLLGWRALEKSILEIKGG